ncbi:metallophosphoesterase family protein [Pseudomonas sp. DTU_2021_1001937_2_SI_NGA_ILE_001]|uniref:metallophosphoesterase family protein n=1 Tax=Pseudomonas sp. DTU_2021_1001937_2_SI_NGA_ILE_001 TaxID=3077589 RepID=UPI0028FC1A7B|nr:metallophosphoesterase family protein [Pseudomonas sp. DTU_2021_1001937_2_SI_NGA_ILE_001]WNW10189.1 metallophosphoesterase family protein [Pseudomonas sp. DTU_2021_1001937_2_SI_NGA_ILE_001]
MKVGVISDTHGLLRPEALAALQGCARIVHAGDIGKPEILEQLARLAPLHVVRGNNDLGFAWADKLPDQSLFDLEGWQILLVHDRADVPAELAGEIKVVITGHSHKPLIDWRGERLWLNPGSAGPRRFKLPVTVAILELGPAGVEAQLVPLLQ